MGYTHYWYKIPILSEDSWKDFIQDFNKVLPHFQNELDQTSDQQLEITNKIVYFNGIEENSHETFYFERKQDMKERFIQKDENGFIFGFCKTARKPYDLAVCVALICAKKHFGDLIKVSSDGEDEDGWLQAKQLCDKVLEYGLEFYIISGVFIFVAQK